MGPDYRLVTCYRIIFYFQFSNLRPYVSRNFQKISLELTRLNW